METVASEASGVSGERRRGRCARVWNPLNAKNENDYQSIAIIQHWVWSSLASWFSTLQLISLGATTRGNMNRACAQVIDVM